MIPNKTPASAYRVRTLDRNDLNEKGKIYIGQGGTSTVDGVEGVSNVAAENIIDAINNNQTSDKYVQLKDKENLLNLIYPIGSIYITTDSNNPKDFLGGTWELFGQGKTLVGVKPEDTTYGVSGNEGGEYTHTLTNEEMPMHKHTEYATVGNIAYNKPTSAQGNDTICSIEYTEYDNKNVSYEPTVLTGWSGEGQPHNNMPPYITVYMYKRTA